MRKALRPYADDISEWKRPLNKLSRKIFGGNIFHQFMQPLDGHAKAWQYREYLGESFNDYFSFGFVRNPFDWHISLYEYIRQTSAHPEHAKFLEMSFSDYLMSKFFEESPLQKSFLFDGDGKIIVDFIGKFENIGHDFEMVTKRIGIASCLPHKNSTRRGKVKEYFSEETAELVVKRCSEDFDAFGYDKQTW